MLVAWHRVWTDNCIYWSFTTHKYYYNTVANLRTLQIIIVCTVSQVFASHCLVLDANSTTSPSVLTSLPAGYCLTTNLWFPRHGCWLNLLFQLALLYNLSYSIVACWFIDAEMCFGFRCLGIDISLHHSCFQPSCHNMIKWLFHLFNI